MAGKLKTSISLLLGLVILIALLRYVNVDELANALKEADPTYIAVVIVPQTLTYLLRGLRWKLLLTL